MALSDFFRRVFGFADRPTSPYKPASMTFLELDIDAIKQDLRLQTRGKRRGEVNQPPQGSSDLDEVESEITAFVLNERKRSTEDYLAHMRALAARLSHLDLERAVVRIKNEARKVHADFRVRAMQGLDTVQWLRDEERQGKSDLNAFQQDHNRSLGASFKPLSWMIVSVLVILFLLVAESYVNGTMLGLGLRGGTSTGLAYAIGFSGINIMLGFIGGQFCYRQTKHVKRTPRIFGWFFVALIVVIVIAFNLGVAHFRDALTGDDWARAQTAALERMQLAPFQLASLDSYALFGLGVLVCLITAIDIYFLDDPYPGYGKITRAYRKAREQLMDGKDEVRADLEQSRNDATRAMDINRDQAGRWRAEFGALKASTSTLTHAFAAHLAHLESVGSRLLEYYRAENVQARKEPPPARFGVGFSIDTTPPEVTSLPLLTEQRVTELVQEATEVLKNEVATLNAEYETQMQRFAQIVEIQ